MRSRFLFVVGLVFLGATLLEVGSLLFRLLPSRQSNRSSLSVEALQPPAPVQPSGLLRLSRAASPSTYEQVGQLITYTYTITNTGMTPLGPAQFVINDNKLGPAINCGPADIILAPQQPINCSRSYVITQTDMSVARIVSSAIAVGGGETTASTIVIITNLGAATTQTPTPGGAKPTATPTGTTSPPAAQRITIPAGQTWTSLAGIVNPSQMVSYVINATQGQALAVSLTGPSNTEVTLGVFGPTGLALKSPDGVFTWNSTVTTGGDHTITVTGLSGVPNKSYTLTVSLTGATTPTFTTPAAGTPTATPSPAPTLVIEAEWPKKLEVGQPGIVRISLIRTGNDSYLPTIVITGNAASASTARPVGTPGVDVASAFGVGYEASAIASFSATMITISPDMYPPQPLDQSRIDWKWIVSSNNPGRQIAIVSIEVEWRRPDGTTLPRRKIWDPPEPIAIEITQPFLTLGQLSIATLLSGAVGSGLSFPFLYGIVKERNKGTQEKPKRKSRNG